MIRIKNTQYSHFLQKADALRGSGLLCDAIISVKSQTFTAHRLVLACASRTLAQQFTQGEPLTQIHCNLESISPKTFQQVLDFTYTQALDVSAGDLPLLLRTAQLLQMPLLENECRKQFDSLHCNDREESKGSQVTEKENTKNDEKKKEGPENKKQLLQDRSSLAEKKSADPSINHSCLPSTGRKIQSIPESDPQVCSIDSVIARPTTSISSFCSPWTLSTNMWESVSSLRRIAKHYSNVVTTHPPQTINPFSAAQPFSPSSPHMLPLLGSRHQTPGPSFSSISYSGLQPHYTQNLINGSTRTGSVIKEGRLKRKKPSQRELIMNVQRDDPCFPQVSKSSISEGDRHCEPSSSAKLEDSVSSQPGRSCAGCHYCGHGDACESQSRRDVRGEKPHQCHHCPKKFSLKHQLDTHHRVHTGEKPFECRLCGQRSRDYSAMIKHLRTHGGALPYQCSVCLEFCSSLVAMQRHIKGHAVQDFPPDWSISCTYLYISHI